MKTAKAYLRVAKASKGLRFAISKTPNYEPLKDNNYKPTYYPTVMFAVKFNIPDELFEQASQELAEITLSAEKVKINTSILTPEVEVIEED